MYRESSLERKHWTMMAKWAAVSTFISTATILGVGLMDAVEHAKSVTQVTAVAAFAGFLVLGALLGAQVHPKIAHATRALKDTFILRGTGVTLGWLVGAFFGLAFITLG